MSEMSIEISSSNDLYKTKAFLMKLQNAKYDSVLDQIGAECVSALRAVTPRKSGSTAAGWGYTVKKVSNGYEMGIYNNSHPETPVNVAIILDKGHGTGTGGWVPGRHYIHPAVAGILDKAVGRLEAELE